MYVLLFFNEHDYVMISPYCVTMGFQRISLILMGSMKIQMLRSTVFRIPATRQHSPSGFRGTLPFCFPVQSGKAFWTNNLWIASSPFHFLTHLVPLRCTTKTVLGKVTNDLQWAFRGFPLLLALQNHSIPSTSSFWKYSCLPGCHTHLVFFPPL